LEDNSQVNILAGMFTRGSCSRDVLHRFRNRLQA